jgi:uncharacterized protein DUF1761
LKLIFHPFFECGNIFLAGIWVFCFVAIHGLFEHKPWRLIFINGGHSIVALTLMGAVIGLWR